MWIPKHRVEQEVAPEGADGGMGLNEAAPPEDIRNEAASETPSTFSLRDLDEDNIYSRLQQVPEFPKMLSAAESRMFGSLGPLTEKLTSLEKGLGTRATVNTEALKGLEEYDPKLAEVLTRLLPDAINSAPLDDSAMSPFLDPMRDQLQDFVREQIVSAFYTPERINEIVPQVKDGVLSPQGQEQEDFVNWLSQQGHSTHQAVQQLGPQYVRAMQQFEKWQQDQVKERETAAAAKSATLAGGDQPSANGRRNVAKAGPQNEAEAFSQGFAEVMKSRQRR